MFMISPIVENIESFEPHVWGSQQVNQRVRFICLFLRNTFGGLKETKHQTNFTLWQMQLDS